MQAKQQGQQPQADASLLFFSGGSALRQLSRKLKTYTHSSVHLITPFDSGGSSATLREAFDMPSVGDLRNRLIALADETALGNPEIYRLFSSRLDIAAEAGMLREELSRLVAGTHPLIAEIPAPLREHARAHLERFSSSMPTDFDLRGASIGNLVLVGGYLASGRDMDAIASSFAQLIAVLGIVLPVADASLHIEAELADGQWITGQHLITSRRGGQRDPKIARLRLCETLQGGEPGRVEISPRARRHIEEAAVICFPMGSFWTSLVANLLPSGVGRAIAGSGASKVYIPNLGEDPEQHGMTISDCIRVLHHQVAQDLGADVAVDEVVGSILIDHRNGAYGDRLDLDEIASLGVQVVDLDLVTENSHSLLDATLLSKALLALAR